MGRVKDMILLLYSVLRLIWLGAPQHKKDSDIQEQVQQKAMKIIQGLGHLSCEERLRGLGSMFMST